MDPRRPPRAQRLPGPLPPEPPPSPPTPPPASVPPLTPPASVPPLTPPASVPAVTPIPVRPARPRVGPPVTIVGYRYSETVPTWAPFPSAQPQRAAATGDASTGDDDDRSTLHTPQVAHLDDDAARRNTLAMLASRFAIAAMGWGGSVLVARVLGEDDFGRFSFVFGLLGLLAVVTDLGVGRVVLARLVECNPWEVGNVTTAFIALRGVLGLFGYGLAVAYVLAIGSDPEVVRATLLGGLVVVVATPSHALSVMFQSRLRMTYVAVAETVGQVAQLAITIGAALFAPTLLWLVVPAVVNEIVAAIIKIRGVRHGVAGPLPSARLQVWRWREMLREAVPLSIGFALVTLLSKVDVIMLERLRDFDAVGLYSIGYKFSDLISIVAMTVVTPVTTLLVASWPADPEMFRKRTRDAAMILILLGVAATAAFWPSATAVLTTLYGDRFGASGESTRLLVLGSVLSMLTQLGLMVLVATARHRVYPWVAMGGLLLNVALNFVLIPALSFEGAAIATVATEAALFVAIWIVVARTIPGGGGFLPIGSLVGLGILGLTVTVWATLFVERYHVPWIVVSVFAPLLVLAGAHYLPLTGGVRPIDLIKSRGGE